jgi:hypothetical protein
MTGLLQTAILMGNQVSSWEKSGKHLMSRPTGHGILRLHMNKMVKNA